MSPTQELQDDLNRCLGALDIPAEPYASAHFVAAPSSAPCHLVAVTEPAIIVGLDDGDESNFSQADFDATLRKVSKRKKTEPRE